MPAQPSYPVARLDYELPAELIAQTPSAERSASRMLHVDCRSGSLRDLHFRDLPGLLSAGTIIVLNDSKVVPARLHGTRAGAGGGRVEVLYHSWLGGGVCTCIVGSRGRLPAGERINLPGGWSCELLEPKVLDGIRVRFITDTGAAPDSAHLLEYLARHGETPLPPYIKRSDGEQSVDRGRYQTVYARSEGSVAAPTAGLHFDEALLARLAGAGHTLRYVTLHVGLGTFAPLRGTDLAQHTMHEELYTCGAETASAYAAARAAGQPVMAVGTTSLRVLHTIQPQLADAGSGTGFSGATSAFIYPGQGTDVADLLLTNFHLPRSTLLALVYAFGGEELLRGAYAHAVAARYRFFSYGDCMLIDRR